MKIRTGNVFGGVARARQRGASLLELTMGLGMSVAIGAGVVSLLFELNTAAVENGALFDVAIDTAVASRWLARDIRRAESTDLVPGAAPTGAASFNWTDSGAPVSCNYSLVGTAVARSCDSGSIDVARGVSALGFSRTGDVVTVTLEVTGGSGQSAVQPVELRVWLRNG